MLFNLNKGFICKKNMFFENWFFQFFIGHLFFQLKTLLKNEETTYTRTHY